MVISAGGTTEFRYEVPGVSTASWFCHPPAKAQLQLVITDAVMKTRTEINSDTAKLEELLTEIAASRLAHDDDESMKLESDAPGPSNIGSGYPGARR